MILAKEKLAPFTVHADESHLPIYARINIATNSEIDDFLALDHQNKTPVLNFFSQTTHPSRMDDAFITDLCDRYVIACQKLCEHGINQVAIAADNDGALHQLISPRFRKLSVDDRAQPLFSIFEKLSALSLSVQVILTVEDLAPGGLDATDGIAIARGLFARGLKSIIATAGCKDFPPLVDRRITQKKQTDHQDFLSHEPSLASALWLIEHTHLNVACCAFIDNRDDAAALAHELGIAMIIQKA